MTKEEKELLLKDLCARLPYGVKGKVETIDGNGNEIKDDGVLNSVFINEYGKAYICIDGMEYELDDFKPYLRPMSSMTDEEKDEWMEITHAQEWLIIGNLDKATDWLNAHHFDYRDLIEKGLALEATEGMYNIYITKLQKPIISNNALREGITHFGITQYQIDNWLKKYVDVENLI